MPGPSHRAPAHGSPQRPRSPAIQVATVDDPVYEYGGVVVQQFEHDSEFADSKTMKAIVPASNLLQRFAASRSG